MTIPSPLENFEHRSPSAAFCDPFVHLRDPETLAVVREDTAGVASPTSAQARSSYQEEDNSCPLLQGVPIDCLPPRFRKILEDDDGGDQDQDLSMRFHFYPARIPIISWCYILLASPFAIALAGVSVTLSKETETGGVVVGRVMMGFFAFILVCIGIAAYLTYRKRSLLFAKDRDGNRKPWPGDWKEGVYLVGSSALLYLGARKKTWLFPVDSIVRVDHFKLQQRHSVPQTILVVLAPPESNKETFRYQIRHLEESRKGKEIQRWHERSTASSTAAAGTLDKQ